jgi:hypothetical protein
LPGVRLPRAQPIDRPLRGKKPDRSRPRAWLDHLRVANAQPADDPHVLPPTLPGQLVLIRPRRSITDNPERASAIASFAARTR